MEPHNGVCAVEGYWIDPVAVPEPTSLLLIAVLATVAAILRLRPKVILLKIPRAVEGA